MKYCLSVIAIHCYKYVGTNYGTETIDFANVFHELGTTGITVKVF